MSFAKNMGKNIGKYIVKNLSGKYSQKLLGNAKQSATDTCKNSSKRAIQEAAKATGDFVSNKITDAIAESYDGKITKVSRNVQKNNSETVIYMMI